MIAYLSILIIHKDFPWYIPVFTSNFADFHHKMALSSTTLLVRHLPSCLTPSEKEHLLKHFGAERVKVMGLKGALKHVAFATFSSKETAQVAMKRLHQMDILDCKLVVEFAKTSQAKHFPSNIQIPQGNSGEKAKKKDTDVVEENQPSVKKTGQPPVDAGFQKWSLEYPRNPAVHYLYPPPTAGIVTNIANTLAAYPKFYVQVLHLMNKMNLPAPFGHMTPQPPIPNDPVSIIPQQQITQQQEAEISSEEGSEIEGSDGEQRPLTEDPSRKRTKRATKLPSKRLKIVALPRTEELYQPANQGPVYSTKEVFEQPENVGQRKIQLRIPEAVVLSSESVEQNPDKTEQEMTSSEAAQDVTEGFGKIQPVEKVTKDEEMRESELPYRINPEEFLSKHQIKKGRIADSEMKHFSVFKNYKPGDQTSRLYIKNLAKATTEQDLVNVYGSFINWSNPTEQNMFDIRLMKEGRMKGQAFLTFPSEDQAKEALTSTNGYVLHSKPMAVQYARSAKAKEVSKPVEET